MKKPKKKDRKKDLRQITFEEIDHRLSCGWHAQINQNVQRKKYLPHVKNNPQNNSFGILEAKPKSK